MSFMFASFADIAPPPGQHGAEQFEVFFKIMMGFNVVIVAAFCALFGWIMKRLLSEDIRREFAWRPA